MFISKNDIHQGTRARRVWLSAMLLSVVGCASDRAADRVVQSPYAQPTSVAYVSPDGKATDLAKTGTQLAASQQPAPTPPAITQPVPTRPVVEPLAPQPSATAQDALVPQPTATTPPPAEIKRPLEIAVTSHNDPVETDTPGAVELSYLMAAEAMAEQPLPEEPSASDLSIDQMLLDPPQEMPELEPAVPRRIAALIPEPVTIAQEYEAELPEADTDATDPDQTIDLGAALGLAGGNAWTIQLARARTVEAHAEVIRAKSVLLPHLQFGIGYNKHEGRIQASPGNIIEASRNSFFVGGGATLNNAPVAGGAGGPFRLAADLALADAYFGPMIARRNYQAERFGISVAKNDAMLAAGNAYIDLLESAGRVADAQAAIAAADELVNLTRTFEEAGAGAQADVDRAATERARLQQELENAERMMKVRSATLARRVRLDATVQLLPADQYVVPVTLVERDGDVFNEIGTAMSARPEICELSQRIAALCVEVKKEQVAPWIPNVTMATSGGTFRGGEGSRNENDGGRYDLDLQAVWQLDNMGRGVVAKRKRAAARLQQQRVLLADLRDEIKADVVRAHEDVLNYWSQIQTAESALRLAETSYERNLLRVRNDEGLPIELLQAISARADGLRARTGAVANYNRAQLRLLYAMGKI